MPLPEGTQIAPIEPAYVSRRQRRPLLLLGLVWLALAMVVALLFLRGPTPIVIEWQTETEVNAAGFHLYRAEDPAGPFTRLNEQLIPARGSAISGATYEYVDEDVTPGVSYYYRLEDVELDSRTTQHDIVTFTAPSSPWWLPVVIIASVFIGVVLFLRGMHSGARDKEKES